jgi:AcrR family transcriptional regulator
MARNREFDPKEALEKAMMVFWQKGYVDTSIDDLVDATGVSRYGLYAEFGSKRGLFLASLDYYQENAVQAFFGIVEQAGAALPEIRLYFDKILDFYSQPAGKLGCLMCNSATEVAPHDQGVKEKVNGAMERMTTGFGVALTNAKKRGEVKSKLNIKQAADFLTGVLLGASVMVRSGANKKMIRNTVEMSLASL